MNLRSRCRAGLGFTEILVTMVVVGVILVPILALFSQGSTGTIRTRDELTAHLYADEAIDFLRARGFAAAIPTGDDGIELPEIRVGDHGTRIDQRYTRTIRIAAVEPADHHPHWPVAYRLITVEVSWESAGQRRAIALTSTLAAGGQHP
jgi:type II secretory pathway pseudopilin PulG